MDGTERCATHAFEQADEICAGCGAYYCASCLVSPWGPRKPQFCVGCAISRAGVRSTAARPATGKAKDIRKAARATTRAPGHEGGDQATPSRETLRRRESSVGRLTRRRRSPTV